MEIIANDMGNRTTPSYVGFTDSERLIGDAAKNQVCQSCCLLLLNSLLAVSSKTLLSAAATGLHILMVCFFLQVAMNPTNTVFDAKRLIGRKFQDTTIQQDIKHWPFTVKPGPGDKPMIEGMAVQSTGLGSLACQRHYGSCCMY